MEERLILYDQEASYFSLRLFLPRETTVEGPLVLELTDRFLADLVLPGCQMGWLWTKRADDDAKLNTGDFSERRWKDARKKIADGRYSVLHLDAKNPFSPGESITFSAGFNPTSGADIRIDGDIEVHCRLSYLRRLAASPAAVEKLLDLGKTAWNGLRGGAAYGFGSVAVIPKKVPFMIHGVLQQGWRPPWEYAKPPVQPVHPIPVAFTGSDIDGNLQSLYCKSKGIKGAYWANFLNPTHIGMAGGEQQIRAGLPGARIERLEAGGLLVVATESPLPEDSEENRERFLRLYRVLQPAFLSREETPPGKRDMLGYFYREYPA